MLNLIPISFWFTVLVLAIIAIVDYRSLRVPWYMWLPIIAVGFTVVVVMQDKVDIWSILYIVPIIVFLFITGLIGGADILGFSYISLTQPWGQLPVKTVMFSFAIGTAIIVIDVVVQKCRKYLHEKDPLYQYEITNSVTRHYPFTVFIFLGFLLAGLMSDVIV